MCVLEKSLRGLFFCFKFMAKSWGVPEVCFLLPGEENGINKYFNMKTSRVMTEILRHPWMMDLRAVEGFLPVVSNWLLGKEVTFEEKGTLRIKAAMAATFTPYEIDDLADVPENTMAIIPVKGEMLKYDSLCSHGTLSIAGLMKTAALNKNISGVVLDVDSPGGSVNAIPPMLEAIRTMQQMKKPVVVHGDLVASAALYASVFADYIVADNELSSEFGSIGVMVQFTDFKDHWEKEGIKIHTVYAPESKDKNAEFEAALKDDYEPLQKNILSPLAKMFQESVKLRRGNKLNLSTEGLLTGKMFFGGDAVKAGLADEVGSLYRAVQVAYSMSEWKRMKSA